MKRPVSVTIVGWLFIVIGVVGVGYHASELSLQRPFANDALWVIAVRLAATLFGVLVLRGNKWARWGIVGWLGYHVILSIWHTPAEIVIHGALLMVIVLVLFRPGASRYFSRSAVTILLCVSSSTTVSVAQQVADTAFTPPIVSPEYARGQGPLVLIDGAHRNLHTADERYLSFGRLLRRDGYVVESKHRDLQHTSLDRADILVISNAMHEQSASGIAPLPNHSAFSDAEIAAVEA